MDKTPSVDCLDKSEEVQGTMTESRVQAQYLVGLQCVFLTLKQSYEQMRKKR